MDQTVKIGKLTEANLAKQKPAWARTEEEQGAAEDEEVEDLLEFAENLDIDKYMDDYEFNEALAAAKARITELDEELGDEGAEAEAEVATVRTGMSQGSMMSERLKEKAAAQEAKDKEWDARTNPDGEGRETARSRASRAIAEEMLEMNPVSNIASYIAPHVRVCGAGGLQRSPPAWGVCCLVLCCVLLHCGL